LKVVTEEAVRMSDGKLFHAVGPATQNARLPRRRHSSGTRDDKVSTSCRAEGGTCGNSCNRHAQMNEWLHCGKTPIVAVGLQSVRLCYRLPLTCAVRELPLWRRRSASAAPVCSAGCESNQIVNSVLAAWPPLNSYSHHYSVALRLPYTRWLGGIWHGWLNARGASKNAICYLSELNVTALRIQSSKSCRVFGGQIIVGSVVYPVDISYYYAVISVTMGVVCL